MSSLDGAAGDRSGSAVSYDGLQHQLVIVFVLFFFNGLLVVTVYKRMEWGAYRWKDSPHHVFMTPTQSSLPAFQM